MKIRLKSDIDYYAWEILGALKVIPDELKFTIELEPAVFNNIISQILEGKYTGKDVQTCIYRSDAGIFFRIVEIDSARS